MTSACLHRQRLHRRQRQLVAGQGRGHAVLWAEDGAISYKDAYLNPGAFYHPAHPDPPCLSCQANYYEATLRTIFCNEQLRPWFGGVYVSATVGLS